jgi:hypothetical protein
MEESVMSVVRRSVVLLAVIVSGAQVAEAQVCYAARSVGPRRSNHSTHIDTDNKRLQARWTRGDCELRVDARGDFGVRGDLTGFTSVEDGGYVQLGESDAEHDRMVRITSVDGKLQYRWRVDGKDGFDVDRDRWLASFLRVIEQRSAMFAKARIPELLRQGGPNRVLDEAARMETDHTRRIYYTTLLASARLNDSQTERMLRDAADSMTSDFERAELLRAVAKQGQMSDRVALAAIRAAQGMTSDFEKRRALSAGLESVTSPGARTALFTAASTMTSDFELAELLIAAQARAMVDSVSSAAYFKAVDRMRSDFEHRRTLTALLKSRPESPQVLAGVLKSGSTIESDFELASLLVEFTRVVQVRGEIRELYLRAARSIDSDFEYRRALQALLDQDRRS